MILLSNLGLLTFIMDNIISWRWDIGDCPVLTVQLIVPSHNIATLTILELQSITSKLVLWLRKKLHEQIKTLTSWKHFYQWVRVTTKKKKILMFQPFYYKCLMMNIYVRKLIYYRKEMRKGSVLAKPLHSCLINHYWEGSN